MIESTFRKTIEQFSDIIGFVEKLELSEDNDVLSFIREYFMRVRLSPL